MKHIATILHTIARIRQASVLLMLGLLIVVPARAQVEQERGVSQDLLNLEAAFETTDPTGNKVLSHHPDVRVRGELVLIDALSSSDGEALLADLEGLGLEEGAVSESHVSGWLPITAIGDLEGLPTLRWAKAAAVAADPAEDNLPERFVLGPNYPNPFNPVTTISYQLAEAGHVTIEVYSLLGQLVDQLVDGELPAGRYDVTWDAGNLPTGIYMVRMQAGPVVKTRRVTLLK